MPILSTLAGMFGYGRGSGSLALKATGGTESTYNGYKYHVFDSPGSFVAQSYSSDSTLEVLVIAAGGGGGTYYYCGGSGAGGLVHVTNYPASTLFSSSSTVSVTVAGQAAYDSNGGPSSFGGITTNGGGRGAGVYYTGQPGGSGGGGSLYYKANGSATQPGVSQSVGTGTLNFNRGFAGGTGPGWPSYPPSDGSPYGGAGGGGAGSVGGNYGSRAVCGDGGIGLVFPQFTSAANPLLPPDGGFAGGGGGGAYVNGNISSSYRGFGGYWPAPAVVSPNRYGAGDGAPSGSNHYGNTSGAARTGSGAGGSDYPNATTGGSGIVVIRYIAP